MNLEIQTVGEEVALEKFREMVSNLNCEEETLLRFLRARDLHLHKAEEMLRKSVKWREDNKVSSYADWVPPKAIADDYTYNYIGTDYEGYPVLYVPLGRWNVRDRIEDGYLDDTNKFRFFGTEAILMPMIKATQRSQSVCIINVAELNFHKVAHVKTINWCIGFAKDVDANYPERIKTVFIINASWVFTYAFSLIKPWMAPKTLRKLQIFDSNKSKWLPAITQTMQMEILPREILT